MDESTSLDALLPSPQGPQSVPPVIPQPSSHAPMAPSFKPTLPAVRFMFANTTTYIAFFVAAVIISLSTPRNLLLQYIPSAYTSSGVVSWSGAAVLGAAAVVIAHLLRNFLAGFLG